MKIKINRVAAPYGRIGASMNRALLGRLARSGCLLAAGLALSTAASATVITAQLTGDPRAANPDGLIVDVTITFNEGAYSSNAAFWVVDINSPLHTGVKLDEFYFNLGTTSSPAPGGKLHISNITFSDFTPLDWSVEQPADVQGGGSFNPTFLFQALDPSGKPNADDVTNAQNLSFLMTLTSGDFETADFTSAFVSKTSETVLGSGRLGAHLQSLTVDSKTCPENGCGDSGFALGTYQGPDNPGGDDTPIPEPGSLALFGAGLLGAGLARLRRRRG